MKHFSFIDTNITNLKYYPDIESATKAVEIGECWGVLSMDANFTENLYERLFDSLTNEDMRTVNEDLLNKSSIKIKLDITNQHIAFTLQMKFVEAFQSFMSQLVRYCKEYVKNFIILRTQ